MTRNLLAVAAILAISVAFFAGENGVSARPVPADEATKKQLQAALESGDDEKIARAIPPYAQGATIDDIKVLLQIGVNNPQELIWKTVREALISSADEAALAFYHRFVVRPRDQKVTVLILEALALIDKPGSIPPLIEALDKLRDPVLLVEVVRALGTKKDKAAISALLTFLPKVEEKRGELWVETRVSLVEITGEDFDLSEDWQRWWKTNEKVWQPPTNAGDRGNSRTGVFRRDRDRPEIELPEVFGIELPAKRLVFILDTSRSMENPFEGYQAEEGADPDDRPTRLAAAQKELIGAIEQLKRDVQFTVISYSSKVKPLAPEGELKKASSSVKRRAQNFVRSLKPSGKTSTEAALLAALAVSNVRTIVLISDGIPTDTETGDAVPWLPIIDRVSAANRFKRVAIHAIGLERSLGHFLQALVNRNNGTYKLVN